MTFEVAHGQLDEKELEKRMLSFLRGDADVLVATSIIESGIDIPQANTLIVERADTFGLSQLYQIRGRGRPQPRARLRVPPVPERGGADAWRPPTASARCRDYTELGAGFKVAMRDLELRGAGNLLGDEQSGHVAALGFELYMQMLDEAVQAPGGRRGDGDRPSPCASTSTSTPTCPPTTSPTSRPRSTCTGASRRAYEVAELEAAARRAGGPLRPDPRAARATSSPPAGRDQARPGRGAGGVLPRQRLAVTPSS